MAERRVWLRQAPHAFKKRTLTPATALSFERYCRAVVLEDAMAVDPDRQGTADHRGQLQRVNTFELQFKLTALGKPDEDVAPSAVPANPLERFLKPREVAN
jgi:hypothetical protein